MSPTTAAVHHAILTTLVDSGRAPSADELATRFRVDRAAIAATLRALADDHGVVLHPHTPQVWVAHPFATAPTPFVVARGDRRWWSPCAWCALGAAALVDDGTAPVTIATSLGAEGEPVTLTITDGTLDRTDLIVHFPVPMRRAWDNVLYTCSVMQLFTDVAAVDEWAARHGIARGDVQPVEHVRAFAAAWYGRHLDPDWRKWTVDEAAALFARFGLTGDTWDLDDAAGRF